MNGTITLARHLSSQGFCVIPLLPGGKRPARRWKRFQTERPTDAELYEWFSEHDYEPAIVTGAISGITVIDCDSVEAEAMCQARGIRSDLTQRTNRGVHLVFRHTSERNTIGLDDMSGVDRRGEGGYVRAYPDSITWTREAVSKAGISPQASGHRERCDTEDGDNCEEAGGDAPVWDAVREAWRIVWIDLDGCHDVWLDDAEMAELNPAAASHPRKVARRSPAGCHAGLPQSPAA